MDTFGIMPYKQAAPSTNGFLAAAQAYMDKGCYSMNAATNFQPDVDNYRAAMVSALNQYNADQSDANWVLNRDWAALEDVTPFAARRLWVCTIASIAINSVSLLIRPERESAADKADGEQKD